MDGLTAEQTAARLGVKPQTLYAYVSRGLLHRTRTATGSLFDALEVERFAASRSRRAAPTGSGVPLMVIDTDVALIEDGELYLGGRSASELARERTFEGVLALLFGDPGFRIAPAPGDPGRALGATLAALPGTASARDRMIVALTTLAATDPFRYRIDPAAIGVATGGVLHALVGALPERGGDVRTGGDAADDDVPDGDVGFVAALWGRLADGTADAQRLRVLEAALVLMIDHDLAPSTFAARVAASARAPLASVLIAGLAAHDSALHGNAARSAYRVLGAVLDGRSPDAALAEETSGGASGIPGFGHRLYPGWDPRARTILDLLADVESAGPAVEAARAVIETVERRVGVSPNVDLALAAMALGLGMDDEAPGIVFSLARCAGWALHARAEYAEEPLRLRPVGNYVGP